MMPSLVILFCLYALVSFSSAHGLLLPSNNVSVSALLVFGDSFVDQGNNNYVLTLGKGNYLPYGKDFMGGIPTGRFSNGKTLPDFLAEGFGLKEYLPAYLDPANTINDLQTGVSFASGGSGLDSLTTTITTAIPMSHQLDMFKEYVGKLKSTLEEEAANTIIANSVVVICAGNNDLFLSLPIRKLQYDDTTYFNMLVKLLLDLMEEIYTLGVRRIVVFSTPPIGCLPEMRTLYGGLFRKCGDSVNEASQSYNNILKQQLQLWESSFPQSRVAFVDYYNPLLNMIENASNYGFDVANRGCCGTGLMEVLYLCNKLTFTCSDDSKYLFWDGFHLTERGNSVLVNQILPDLVNTLFYDKQEI